MTRREKLTAVSNYYFSLMMDNRMTDDDFKEHTRVLETICRLYYGGCDA